MSTRIHAVLALPFLVCAATAGCAREANVPSALADARAACARLENGPARQFQPASVHEAEAACADAEVAYEHHSDRAELLAVLADRKAQLAESLARTEIARREAGDAVAQQRMLVEVRAAEARAIADHDSEGAPQTGAAEMQPKTAQPPR